MHHSCASPVVACFVLLFETRGEVGCNNPPGIIGLWLVGAVFVPVEGPRAENRASWLLIGCGGGVSDWTVAVRPCELSSVLLAKLWPGARKKKSTDRAATRHVAASLLQLLRIIRRQTSAVPLVLLLGRGERVSEWAIALV